MFKNVFFTLIGFLKILKSIFVLICFFIFQESPVKSHVMGIELQNNSPFIEERLESILNKVSIFWL